jgi:uncharacterized phage protein gp47/JayE
MPFNRPSPQQIRDRLAAEIEAALPGADARRRRSVEEVLVRAMAVASHELHGHIAWAARQLHVTTAEGGLLESLHGAVWGIPRLPAATATGAVTVAGTPGARLSAGAEMRRPDDARFTLNADVVLGVGGTGTGQVTAVLAGAAGNTQAGTTLTLLAPAAGIQPAVTVATGGLAAGADLETDAALRARILARIQQPPAGGAAADYALWARRVAGVDRVWVYPRQFGLGTVGVTFLGPGAAIPAAPLVAQVQAEIDALRPVTAEVTVFAPLPVPVPVQLQISPDSTATRAAVQAAIAGFFVAEAEPGGTLRVSRLRAAISAAAGEVWHALAAPSADVVLPAGQVATLGTVTWL